jgi:hypothetical protein
MTVSLIRKVRLLTVGHNKPPKYVALLVLDSISIHDTVYSYHRMV